MSWKQHIKYLGPGLVVAATGVGAGDLIAASVGGANFGYIILWSALVGALIKYTLNEGVARWQLESQLSIIEAWRKYFPSWISTFFLIYLMIWSFIVGAALSSACGLAAHAIFPILSIPVWGIIQAVIALILVVFIQYSLFEKVMKILIAVMFSLVIFSTFLSQPDWWKVLKGVFIPGVPAGSIWLILGIIGGVGGSVSILSYGYWIKEKNWKEKKHLSRVKVDLTVAYILTALFALAIMIMAAELHPDNLNGSKIVLSLAEKIGKTTGKTGEWIFLLGFWGAVFSSMLGVWQGIPFLFADFMRAREKKLQSYQEKNNQSYQKHYRLFLIYIALIPLILLFFQKPVWIIITYAIIGSLFMPFLAFTLYWLNNKRNTSLKNPKYINVLLWVAFLLFIVLMFIKIKELLM